jgi:exopolyphosphatase / guanosine-5'-triphosphate,3'-diphosphate pyrophosphatase
MRLAVLDVGSNTAHVVIVNGEADGTFRPVASQRTVLRLAEAAFPTMNIPDDAAEKLAATVDRMREFAAERGADAMVAFATSAIREASNGMEVLGRVREVTGVPIGVLPGAEEARLTYRAARAWAAFSGRRLLVVDIGGGSLEVAGGADERPEIAQSLPLGATRLSRRFLRADPASTDELAALRVHALTLLGPLAERVGAHSWDIVCATSKTFRTLTNVAEALPHIPSPSLEFGFAGVDGHTAPVLTDQAVQLVAGYLAKTSHRDRTRLRGLDRLRADNVVAGSQLAALVMQAFGLNRLVLAPWALREGVIIEHLQRVADSAGRRPVSGGRRLASVVSFEHRYSTDEEHSRLVADLAVSLFDQLCEVHELGDTERELLYFAGLLHDVGFTVSQSAHHKHSLYIIENGDLEGFTERERRLIANIARYHRKAMPADHHVEYTSLSDDDRRLVRQLAALLRIADGLDLDHSQVVEAVEVRMEAGTISLAVHALDEPRVALPSAERNADLFEAEFRLPVRVVSAGTV